MSVSYLLKIKFKLGLSVENLLKELSSLDFTIEESKASEEGVKSYDLRIKDLMPIGLYLDNNTNQLSLFTDDVWEDSFLWDKLKLLISSIRDSENEVLSIEEIEDGEEVFYVRDK